MNSVLLTLALLTFHDCKGVQIGGWYPVATKIEHHQLVFVVIPPQNIKGACGYQVWVPSRNLATADALQHGVPAPPIPEELKRQDRR
jgi:hypothetical protein